MSFEISEEEPGTSDLPIMTAEKTCLICADRSDGTHFGVESCRACAAFFRRSVVSGKQYICRHGGPGTCEINKTVRCMCRRCRLEKCFTVGMRKDMVQGRRDPIIPKSKDPEPLCASRNSESPQKQFTPSPTTMLANVYQNVKLEDEEPYFLHRIFENYRNLCAIRRTTEINMDREMAARAETFGPLMGYSLGTCKKMSDCYKAHMPAIWDFLSKTFDEFNCLEHDDKWSVFQTFMVNLWGMDNNYHTYRKIAKEHFPKVIILSETMYFATDRVDEFIGDFENSSPMMRADLSKQIRKCMTKPRQMVLYTMSDMQIEEEEYSALIALMLWNASFDGPEDKLECLKKKMRQKVFEQLHIFYRSRPYPLCAQRLGELMHLHASILVDVLRFREDMELFNLYDAFQDNTFIYEMVRNTPCL